MSEQWPASQASARPALPSVEDLPKNGDGYDPDGVHEAFDAFYRHIAQLDSTLRALEAVDAFSRQAGDLRDELRAFRRARWEEGWNAAYGRSAVPASALRPARALPRIAAEVAFLIAVAVFLGVGSFTARTIVAVMAGAWVLVGLVELAASRASSRRSFPPPQDVPVGLPPAAIDAAPGWQEDEGLTMVAELEPSRRRWFRRRETEAAEG
jgi:hypothetical protein